MKKKNNPSLETQIDELFAQSCVQASDGFVQSTLDRLKECGESPMLDRRLDKLFADFPVEASGRFTENVMESLVEQPSRSWHLSPLIKWALPITAAAALTLMTVIRPAENMVVENPSLANLDPVAVNQAEVNPDVEIAQIYELAMGLEGVQPLLKEGAYETLATLLR